MEFAAEPAVRLKEAVLPERVKFQPVAPSSAVVVPLATIVPVTVEEVLTALICAGFATRLREKLSAMTLTLAVASAIRAPALVLTAHLTVWAPVAAVETA